MRRSYTGLCFFLAAGCYSGSEVDAIGGTDAGGVSSVADTIGETDAGTDGGTDTDSGGEPSVCGALPEPGSAPIRRLTPFELNNTLSDLLGDNTSPAAGLPEEGGSGFDNNAEVGAVSRLVAQKYMQMAENVALRATTDLPGLLGCDAAAPDCVRSFVADFGQRVWRRPLESGEVDDMMVLYDDARGTFDEATAVGVLLEAFLQSPFFLYRVELAGTEATEAVPLDGWEMATRLSYLMWGSMPDDALFAAASAGELQTQAQVEAQARRMLEDPKAQRMVLHFYEQWLLYKNLDVIAKDDGVFPEYGSDIASLQRQEIEAFLNHVIWEGEGSLEAFLTADYTFVNDQLAAFYGIEGSFDSTFTKVDRPGQAAGVVTQGGVMSVFSKPNQTSPVSRGLYVREHLLCQIPPPPPDDVDLRPPEPTEDATTRERYSQHSEDPACAGCHVLMDPLGFGLENYDGVGRWRDTENNAPIDASGVLAFAGLEMDDEAFDGPVELGGKLQLSPDMTSCVARQWFRFAYGRTESAELDACTLAQIDQSFADADYNLRELMVGLTQTDAFLYRPGGAQ